MSLPFGTTKVGLGIIDKRRARAIDIEELTVADTTAPNLLAPPDRTVSAWRPPAPRCPWEFQPPPA